MTWWQKARKLGHFHPASHCERRMALSSSPSCLPHKSLPPATSPLPMTWQIQTHSLSQYFYWLLLTLVT